MNVAEAEARVDGINFYVNDKNITVSARRVEGGGISIVRTNGIKRNLDVRVSDGIVSLIAGVIFFIIKMLLKDFGDFRLDGLIIICLFWGVIMTGYILDALNPKNEQEFKYHAAEHKVLNYWDKYQKITLNCEEIMAMSSISVRCGSTVNAVGMIFVSLCAIGILFVPNIILKIVWCLVCAALTFYLWGTGKCNFLQKMVIKEPSLKEVEVAAFGMAEYIKAKMIG